MSKYLEAYQRAINRIDDYFEYTNESAKDKQFVRSVLNQLTNNLKTISSEQKARIEEPWYDKLNHIMIVTGDIEIPRNLAREAYTFCRYIVNPNVTNEIPLPSVEMIRGELQLSWYNNGHVMFRFTDKGMYYSGIANVINKVGSWRGIHTIHQQINAANFLNSIL